MSLVSRHLEANGIATVIVGAARDVVEHCGVPRFVFTDFPLGNPAGRPYDADMQRAIVLCGLHLLETATKPRTTLQTPFVWSDDEAWKANYMRVDAGKLDYYRAQGDIRRAARERMKASGRLKGWTSGELYRPTAAESSPPAS